MTTYLALIAPACVVCIHIKVSSNVNPLIPETFAGKECRLLDAY